MSEHVDCLDYWIIGELFDGMLCPTAEVAAVGVAGVYLLFGITGFVSLWYWTEDLSMPVVWSVLLGGTFFTQVPGPIPQWAVALATVVLTVALYMAIKRLP